MASIPESQYSPRTYAEVVLCLVPWCLPEEPLFPRKSNIRQFLNCFAQSFCLPLKWSLFILGPLTSEPQPSWLLTWVLWPLGPDSQAQHMGWYRDPTLTFHCRPAPHTEQEIRDISGTLKKPVQKLCSQQISITNLGPFLYLPFIQASLQSLFTSWMVSKDLWL